MKIDLEGTKNIQALKLIYHIFKIRDQHFPINILTYYATLRTEKLEILTILCLAAITFYIISSPTSYYI